MAITAAPVTADQHIVCRNVVHRVGAKATDNTTLYSGTLKCRTVSSGLIVEATDVAAGTATFAGVGVTHVSAVNDGTTPVVELLQSGDFLLKVNTSTVTDAGVSGFVEVYLADNNSVDVAGQTVADNPCGYIVEFVDASHAWVRIDGFAL